jgi:hypothetical protein
MREELHTYSKSMLSTSSCQRVLETLLVGIVLVIGLDMAHL